MYRHALSATRMKAASGLAETQYPPGGEAIICLAASPELSRTAARLGNPLAQPITRCRGVTLSSGSFEV
jgi:hypothetical protein